MARITRYDADQVEAGDTIAIKEGRVRRFYHVCEVHVKGDQVQIVYNVRYGFERLSLKESDRVSIRE
jgi:hypothetical protein